MALYNESNELARPYYGVIKRRCLAMETIVATNNGFVLKPGAMIRILADYGQDRSSFKIIDFENWKEKYKTTIYSCKKDDYIVVTMELWPYLLAIESNVQRVKLVQHVYNGEFDLGIVRLGNEIKIRCPTGEPEKFYKFDVKYNGELKDIGRGYYIGLQLKNPHVSLTSYLKPLSRYYRFDGIGIVVTIVWIMLNLYKEDDCETDDLPKKVSQLNNMAIETGRDAETHVSDLVSEKYDKIPEMVLLRGKPKPQQSNAEHRFTWPFKPVDKPESLSPAYAEKSTDISYANQSNGSVKTTEILTPNPSQSTEQPEKRNIRPRSLISWTPQDDAQLNEKNVDTNNKPTSNSTKLQHSWPPKGTNQTDVASTLHGRPPMTETKLNVSWPPFQSTVEKSKVINEDHTIWTGRPKPNCRMCPNCKHVSFTPHPKNLIERCDKCKVFWCYSCNSEHYPNTPHEMITGKIVVMTECIDKP